MTGPRLYWALFIAFIAIDQAVKVWARGAMVESGSIPVPWPGVFELKLVYNQGVAFGMLQGMGVILAPVALAIVVFASLHSYKHKEDSPWLHIGLGLLSAGALGNLYDRIFHGKVTDMFWIRAIDFPVFNIADACISVAAVLLVFRLGKEQKASPNVEVRSATSSRDFETPHKEDQSSLL